MKAAFYDRNGPADEVLQVAELPMPAPGSGEVLVRVKASGVNPSDVKSRAGLRAKMSWPRVVPHSDGAGVIEAIGAGVDPARVGERVGCGTGSGSGRSAPPRNTSPCPLSRRRICRTACRTKPAPASASRR